MYPVVARWLTEQGFVCWRDVSYLGRWIDLYAERSDGSTVAVELKVADWGRALQQAQLVRAAAERTFIGVWAPYVHRTESATAAQRLTQSGIGVLAVNGECHVRREPDLGPARFAGWVQRPSRASHRPNK